MTRGSIGFATADNEQAIFGLGINETDVLVDQADSTGVADAVATALAGDDSAVATLATELFGRFRVEFLTGGAAGNNRSGANSATELEPGVGFAVEGLETTDILVAATLLRAVVGTFDHVATATAPRAPIATIETLDVLYDTSIDENGSIFVAGAEFGDEDTLVLVWVDLSEPDEEFD